MQDEIQSIKPLVQAPGILKIETSVEGAFARSRAWDIDKAEALLRRETVEASPAQLREIADYLDALNSIRNTHLNQINECLAGRSLIVTDSAKMCGFSDNLKAYVGKATVLLHDDNLDSVFQVCEQEGLARVNLNAVDLSSFYGQFQSIFVQSILFRLDTPGMLLAESRKCLRAEGRLFVDIANSNIHGLLEKESRGLSIENVDAHVRSHQLATAWLQDQGFRVDKCLLKMDDSSKDHPREFIGRPHGQAIIESQIDSYWSPSQFSIVILTHNQLKYTRMCLDSIKRFSSLPYEIIVVDNASTDGTREFLRGENQVKRIENNQNLGFAAGCNQGMRAAQNEIIVLLNNDTIVTPGWLELFARNLNADVNVGLVGPMSNNVSGPQCVPSQYKNTQELLEFARSRSICLHGENRDVQRLVGFCMAFRRDLIEKVGYLDEQFGIGGFEDDDFTLRVRGSGLRTVMVQDAFIHHYGSVSINAMPSGDAERIYLENRDRFFRKWNIGTLCSEDGISAESNSSPDSTTLAKLSVCMIVRDNEATLGDCLRSIRSIADEIVVVDTGSKDRTKQIAESFRARMFDFPWCDDFSAARNESLRHATGDWVFWIDSDDVMDEQNAAKLRNLVDGIHPPNVAGYVVQVHCPLPDQDGDTTFTAVDHVKLFRNHPAFRFEGRIHEQILPALRAENRDVAWTDIFVVHAGSDNSESARARKQERDLRILKKELRDRPDHSFTLFNLGMTYADMANHQKAIEALQQSLKLSKPSESHVRKIYALLTSSYVAIEQFENAFNVSLQGLSVFPQDEELIFHQGSLAMRRSDFAAARRHFESIIHEERERHFTSVDVGILGHKTRHNLALVYMQLGKLDLAMNQWHQITRERPSYRPAWRGLADLCINTSDTVRLEETVARLSARKELEDLVFLYRGHQSEARNDLVEARRNYREAITLSSGKADHAESLHVWARFLFEHGTAEEALSSLLQLSTHDPVNGSTWHNIGVSYLRLESLADAIMAFKRSLELRPGSSSTNQMLNHAQDLFLAASS